MVIDKKNSGGSRAGSGRKKSDPTIVIPFRIKPEWKDRIKKLVYQEMELIRSEEKLKNS